ncbi:hypothetical protein [Pseudonocardia sp. GCM10023141]|uniref:hypothetical protein n=1 Tax=Pseudonocardia sp. GCM10023141 TaxID=3252653 RepID=UPI00362066C9
MKVLRWTHRAVATLAVAAALLVAQAGVSAAATQNRDYAGGYWLYVDFADGNVSGSTGNQARSIYLDRATSANPGSWTGWIEARTNTFSTGSTGFGNYYWRTCVENYQGGFACGGWYRP